MRRVYKQDQAGTQQEATISCYPLKQCNSQFSRHQSCNDTFRQTTALYLVSQIALYCIVSVNLYSATVLHKVRGAPVRETPRNKAVFNQ